MLENKDEVQYLSNVVNIRNHLGFLLNGTRSVIKKQEIQSVDALIRKLDVAILTEAQNLFEEKVVEPQPSTELKTIEEVAPILEEPKPKKGMVRRAKS